MASARGLPLIGRQPVIPDRQIGDAETEVHRVGREPLSVGVLAGVAARYGDSDELSRLFAHSLAEADLPGTVPPFEDVEVSPLYLLVDELPAGNGDVMDDVELRLRERTVAVDLNDRVGDECWVLAMPRNDSTMYSPNP
jgi:hypothetical protein